MQKTQTKCLLMEEWINKMWYKYTKDYSAFYENN